MIAWAWTRERTSPNGHLMRIECLQSYTSLKEQVTEHDQEADGSTSTTLYNDTLQQYFTMTLYNNTMTQIHTSERNTPGTDT